MTADFPTSPYQTPRTLGAGSVPQPEPPASVPGYEMRDFVGKGAYGQVWTAVDRNTGRRVAIKFFAHRPGANNSLLSSEVEKLVFLSSDRYVVQLLEVGWEAEPPFYVMEYVEDGSLNDRLLKSGPIPAAEATHIFRELAIGLSHAHSKGVLHCDLKPANVLLDQDNRPRLADFGQSRLTGEQSPALGTLFFMAPEQADQGAVPDASWDVYALGSLLYCMLTGSAARRSDEAISYIESTSELSEQLARYRKSLQRAPKPEAHRRIPGVDRALADIVDQCLALDPNDRYPNVFAVLQALENRARVRHRRPLWILGLVGPLLLLLATSFFGYRGYQSAIRQANTLAVRGAQASNQFAARLGARAVANELDLRFRAVTQAAADPVLIESMERFLASEGIEDYLDRVAKSGADELPGNERNEFVRHAERQPIQQYLAKLLSGPDASWFVTDDRGTHLAAVFRDITERSSIGDNYAWRTYFHGGTADFKKDFTERGRRPDAPVQSVHLSAVFRSEVTTKWKVAISAPVRNDEQSIIGVVAMTVELGELFVEDFEQDSDQPKGQQYAVVVDGRDGEHQGVILQHPLYDRLVAEGQSVPDHHTSDEFRVELDILSNQKSLVRYQDPLSRDTRLGRFFRGDWIAGIAPIRIEQTRREHGIKQVSDTGLWVLVQTRFDEITSPVESLGWRMLREAAWALAIVCVVTLALWLLVHNMMRDSLQTGVGKFVDITESTIHSRETLEQPKESRSR